MNKKSIDKQVRKIIAEKMTGVAHNVIPPIEQQLRASFKGQTFYDAILSGILRADFGLTNERAKRTTEDLINIIAQRTTARFKLGTGNVVGTLIVEFRTGVPESMLASSTYQSNGNDIPFLSWLLREGTRVIIADYKVDYGNQVNSRSGLAVMVKNTDGAFRVYPAFAGTEDDNIITRWIHSETNNILDRMVQEIMKQFK